MASQSVLISEAEGLITITINRPAARNSLNAETVTALCEAMNAATANPRARCIHLTGAGTDAFCAGADIAELVANSSPSARRAFFQSIADLIEKIQTSHLPVVASVHGFALAGGCGIAAACDITLASEDAVFGLPEAAIGLAALVVMTPISRLIGKKALAHMLLTGERISAKRALEIGLITATHPKDALGTATQELCAKIMKHGPNALKASKEGMLEVTEKEYLTAIREFADKSALLSLGDEASEGLRAFTEKREPSWRPKSS
jgi:methylglutaconyl-CoA hydratase